MSQRDRDVWSAAWREALKVTSLGWDLALPIFGGVLLGHWLDRRLDTGYVFTLGLMMLGVFTGFYNVIRSIQIASHTCSRTDVASLTCSRADRVDARQRLRAPQDDVRPETVTQTEARGDFLGESDAASLTSSGRDEV